MTEITVGRGSEDVALSPSSSPECPGSPWTSRLVSLGPSFLTAQTEIMPSALLPRSRGGRSTRDVKGANRAPETFWTTQSFQVSSRSSPRIHPKQAHMPLHSAPHTSFPVALKPAPDYSHLFTRLSPPLGFYLLKGRDQAPIICASPAFSTTAGPRGQRVCLWN